MDKLLSHESSLIKRALECTVWDMTVGNGSVTENTPSTVAPEVLAKCVALMGRQLNTVELRWIQDSWHKCLQSVLQP